MKIIVVSVGSLGEKPALNSIWEFTSLYFQYLPPEDDIGNPLDQGTTEALLMPFYHQDLKYDQESIHL